MEFEIIQALLQCIENYPEGSENKEWFTKLFQNSLGGQNNIEIDIDLVYNATFMENLLATLLAIDVKTIVKVRMVHKVIITLWEENNWDLNALNNYIMNEKPIPNDIIKPNSEGSLNNINYSAINNQPIEMQQNQIPIPLEEAPSKEVEMANNEQSPINDLNARLEEERITNLQQLDLSTQDLVGEDISKVKYFEIRNRKFDSTNPFHITKGNKFKLGALAVNIPGDNKKEQTAFVANMLKLSSNSDLIKFEFWNGNYWITAGFEYEEDLIFCKDKIKEKDLINVIQLTTTEHNNKIQSGLKSNNTKETTLPRANKSSTPHIVDLMKNKLSTKDPANMPKTIKCGKKRNQYNITDNQTIYKGGFLMANIPGDDRKSQIDYITAILDLDSDNDFISHSFHNGNSWLIVHFESPEDLDKCIIDINNKYKDAGKMIAISNKYGGKEVHNKYRKTQKNMSEQKYVNNSQTYQIIDVPKEYSTEHIRRALKPFGNIVELKISQKRNPKQEKVVQVTIEPSDSSRKLSNSWSIPIGSILARVTPIELCPEIWKDRNQHMARLYGIPKGTDTVLLMRHIKNLKPKTCYVPKCSVSKKDRNFAIVSFQTQEDLDKACSSAARYFNSILTWSKSRSHHIKKRKEEENNTYSSTSKPKNFLANRPITRKNRQESDEMSLISFTSTSPLSRPSTSSKSKSPTERKQKKNKGKEKAIISSETNHTTDKIIAIITQIASRLDHIESNMGIGPNRS